MIVCLWIQNMTKKNRRKNCMATFQNCLLLVPAPHPVQTIQRLNFNIALNYFSLINGSWFIGLYFHIPAVPVTNVGVAIMSPNTVFYQNIMAFSLHRYSFHLQCVNSVHSLHYWSEIYWNDQHSPYARTIWHFSDRSCIADKWYYRPKIMQCYRRHCLESLKVSLEKNASQF